MSKNFVVRVYNDGSRIVSHFHTESLMDSHLEYSVVARFGCAHFRNGKCVSVGYLGKERCQKIEEELTK